ncbi:MAG: LamG domain-containing protein [Sedimentisphaerales bacterium]|nr:LamG domain-containing protein [Sedimentisphaerales bacterium]
MSGKMYKYVVMLWILGLCIGTSRAELIAYWPFEEGQGTETADITGNGNDGTLNGNIEWVSGYKGKGVRFDTAGERIVVGPIDPTEGTNAMTLAAWINWQGQGHSIEHQGIIGKRLGWTTDGATIKWFWEATPANALVFRADYDGGGTGLWWGNSLLELYANEWIHVALTWEDDAAAQYINGEEVSTGTITFRESANATPVTIGCVSSTNNETFVGIIDEVRFYNHVLTQPELQTVMLGEFPTASSPVPADGAIHEDTWVSLSWKAGTLAVSHDVYLGENFDDVNEGLGDTFRGNQPTTFYVAGFPGFAYPEGLVPGTTYSWRIDEVNDTHPDSPWKGEVWSFTVPSRIAYNPNPADGAKFIATDVTLNWMAGLRAKLHYVYFGTDPDEVANATGALPQAVTSYTPGPLELDTTYYWRVDEFDGATVQTGDVWHFTTLPEIPIADPSLVGWWKFDEGNGNIAVDWSGQGNHGALQGDPQWAPGQVGGALEFDGTGDLVDCGANDVFDIATDMTAMCWIKVHQFNKNWQAIVTQGDNSWRLHRSNNTDNIAWGTSGLEPTDITGTINVNDGEWHNVAGVYDGTQKILYVDGNIDASSNTTGSIDSSTYRMQIGENAQATGRNWAGLIDDVRIYTRALTMDEIKETMRGELDLAWDPSPGNGTTPYISDATLLTWSPGDLAAEHDVYFGADRAAVDEADASDTTGIYRGRQSGTSYTPPEGVEWGGGPYYWRIDEVNTDGTISKGPIWTFTVLDYLLVEDFERYTDDDVAGEAIWQHWIDGFGVADNGSQVGYLLPPYAEQTTVHGGRQSMPLLYNNLDGVTNSEATLTLAAPRDWTQQGVGELSLWFHGLPGTVGSFTENPGGTYTMTASGTDIWNEADEFHFAYKTLTGAGSITARIVSVENTNAWAKACVMIRETLDPGSKHAIACITPSNGVASQGRDATDAGSFGYNETGITAPHWVRLERDNAGNFTVTHSTNGTTWQPVTGATTHNIPMASNVYIGLALTSHDAGLTCQAEFSNVTTTGNVSGQWQNQDIGITSNAAEPLYVAISNASGAPGVVAHDNPAAATTDAWTRWRIPLQALADQGINLGNVDKLAIGLGSQSGVASDGGSGTIYIDDIRLYRP